MSENETTSVGAPWRKRAIASVGVAAAVAAGGVALASPADAAVTSASIAARSAIYNLPTDQNMGGASVANQQPLQLTLVNNAAATGTVTIKISGVPSSITCANVTVTQSGSDGGAGGGVAVTSTDPTATGTCYFASAPGTAIPAGTTTLDYTETVNGQVAGAPPGTVSNVTGTLSQQGFFTATGATTSTTSNSVSTTLSSGAAPKATGTLPTTGTFYSSGQTTNVLTPGVPIGNVTVTDQSTNPPTPSAAFACPAGSLGEGQTYCYTLNNVSKAGSPATGAYYNALTGSVRFTGGAGSSAVTDTYQIAEVNGFGAAVVSPTSARAFSDVDNASPFATAILSLAGQNVIAGFVDGTFRPTQPVARQAFAHYLYTLGGGTDGPCPLTNFQQAYSDVPANSAFCLSITFLDSKNVIRGETDGKFNPTGSVTRQSSAAFIFRYYNVVRTQSTVPADAQCPSTPPFSDVTSSNPFCGDIAFLKSAGLATGYSGGSYGPTTVTSRQVAALLLYNYENSSYYRTIAQFP